MQSNFSIVGFLIIALQIPLAEQRLADYRRVVIGDQASAVPKAAADELAHYVGSITGHALAILPWSKYAASKEDTPDTLSFFVGADVAELVLQQTLTPWKEEEWMLRTVPAGLLVAGKDANGDPWSVRTSAGSMLATYTLLEDYLGVHWFWPEPFGEHVPHKHDAVIPDLSLRTTPEFAIRSVSNGVSAYHTAQFAEASRRWARRSRLGWVKSAIFGHSWNDAFHLSNDETFKAHPEWFALVNGKRGGSQMCTTNPEVIEHMVQFVLHAKTDIVNISPSDGGGFCECDRCRALDVPGLIAYDGKHPQISNRIFTYANEVARRVREANPDRGCGMFAYTYYNQPPENIKKLEPNLYLSFVYQSAAMRDPEALASWRELVSGWHRLGAKMVVREGWGNHYYFDLPFLHDRQILENLSEAQRLGFWGAYGDGSKNFAATAPNYWALTRVLWNPQRPTGDVMPEFYREAYGPVAPHMQAYWEAYDHALDQNWSKRERVVPTSGIAYANLIASWRKLIPAAAVDEAEQHLQDAERLAPAGEYADRVRFHRFGQDYTRMMLDLLEAYRQASAAGANVNFPPGPDGKRPDATARQAALQLAFDLGECREQMLLERRDWAGPDEGLYAFTNDRNLRQWHAAVKQELGIDRASAVTGQTLKKSK